MSSLEHDKARGEERVEVRDAPVEGLELRILVPVVQRHAHQLRVLAGWSVVSVIGQGETQVVSTTPERLDPRKTKTSEASSTPGRTKVHCRTAPAPKVAYSYSPQKRSRIQGPEVVVLSSTERRATRRRRAH